MPLSDGVVPEKGPEAWDPQVLSQPYQSQLEQLGMREVDIRGNGHCMFAAINASLTGETSTKGAIGLRKEMLEYLDMNACLLFGGEDGTSHRQIEEMTCEQLTHQLSCFNQTSAPLEHWGGAECILLAALTRGCCVVQLNKGSDSANVFCGDAVASGARLQ